jgi:hypothetical protein
MITPMKYLNVVLYQICNNEIFQMFAYIHNYSQYLKLQSCGCVTTDQTSVCVQNEAI